MYKSYIANENDLNDPTRFPSNMTNGVYTKPMANRNNTRSATNRNNNVSSNGAAPVILNAPVHQLDINHLHNIVESHVSRLNVSARSDVIQQGEQGPRGECGMTGFTGPKGEQGLVGFTGPEGPRGEQGFTGPAGATGPSGLLSIKGTPKLGDVLKYDEGGVWIPIGSNNIYIGYATLENSSNPGSNYNIGIGYKAGIGQDHPTNNTDGSIAIGYLSGSKTIEGDYQESGCISIGSLSSNKGQGEDSISIGNKSASSSKQGLKCIAIGYESGCDEQGDKSVSIGNKSGYIKQQVESVAIGSYSGYYRQGVGSVALGSFSGMGEDEESRQGDYSIAVGYKAAKSGQSAKSIVLDATGSGEMLANSSGLFIKPIRESPDYDRLRTIKYDPVSGELVYV